MAMAEREKPPAAELAIGYITAFLFFAVGFVIGVHVLPRDRTNGIRLILISSAVAVATVLYGIGVYGGDGLLLAGAGIGVALGISIIVEGHQRDGLKGGGIAVTVAFALLGLLVGFGSASDQGGQRSAADTAERAGDKMVQCLESHPQQYKDCERRLLNGK
jgi:hypothetical protein